MSELEGKTDAANEGGQQSKLTSQLIIRTRINYSHCVLQTPCPKGLT